MRWGGGVAVAAALAVAGCAARRPAHLRGEPGASQVGIASWYGPGFHGKRTANGEVYDQHDLTAAHQTLPLGSRVMVTHLATGRAVEVRVNDRGPFVGDRVIDLSYAAARALDMIGPGTAQVRIDVLEAPRRVASAGTVRVATARARAGELPRAIFSVQVAAFGDREKADHLRRVVATRFPDAYLSRLDGEHGAYFRVRIGPYRDRGTADAHAARVMRLGYPAIVMEEPGP